MKVGIIGAGCSGLVSAKYCLENSMECDVFEQTALVGGLWNYTDEVDLDESTILSRAVMYKNLTTNIPKETMSYMDFPYPSELKSYIEQKEVVKYLNNYTDHFNLRPHIKFLKQVVKVEVLAGDRWKVTVKDLQTNTEEEFDYDAMIICNGCNFKMSMPDIPGMSDFKGKAIHSKIYRVPEPFTGMKVLIVGGGPSGCDIGTKLLDVAEKVIIAQRGPLFLKVPDDIVIKPPIKKIGDTYVEFNDGTREQIDAIVYATGYQYTFPFLTDECGIKVENNCIKYLYKHMINVKNPTMAFMGMCAKIGVYPVVDLQVRYFLSALKGDFNLPTKEEMECDVKKLIDAILAKGGQLADVHKIDNQRVYCEDLSKSGHIKAIPDVIHQILIYVIESGIRGEVFKIIDDDNYEKFKDDSQ